MACIVFKGGVLCGDFTPADGKWHRLGYIESTAHKCDNCSMCAAYELRTKGDDPLGRRRKKDARYLCGKCLAKEA